MHDSQHLIWIFWIDWISPILYNADPSHVFIWSLSTLTGVSDCEAFSKKCLAAKFWKLLVISHHTFSINYINLIHIIYSWTTAPHFCCYYYNTLVVVPLNIFRHLLIQINLWRISNWALYLIYRSRLLLHHCSCLGISHLITFSTAQLLLVLLPQSLNYLALRLNLQLLCHQILQPLL